MARKDPYTADVRAAVDERDRARCRRCHRPLYGFPFSRHHRKPRGMGGANRRDAGRLSNVVTLCGSATTPEGCHLWVESNREAARDAGWIVPSSWDPEAVPLVDARGRQFRLLDDGGVVEDRIPF